MVQDGLKYAIFTRSKVANVPIYMAYIMWTRKKDLRGRECERRVGELVGGLVGQNYVLWKKYC